MSSSQESANVRCGWLDRGTKYTKSWTKRFVTLERNARCLKYAESDKKAPKGTILMKKVTRTAEKNETLRTGNPDLFSFAVEGVDPDGKDMMWLLRCQDKSSFEEWYADIRASIAAHGLMEPVHYGLPARDPRCDLPLITVPVEHLFRFSLLDKAIMYYFGVVQLCKPPASSEASGALQFIDHILVLCDKNNYLFNFAADVIRCFPVSALEAIHAGDKCIGLKLQHPQHDVLFRTDAPVAIIEILRRTFSVSTNQDVDVESTDKPPEQIAPTLSLRSYDGHQLQVSAPTPKQKLKHALDVYERQTGQPFVYGSAQNPAQPKDKNAHHTADAMDVEDPMAALLMKIKLRQYIVLMQRQHLDLDVLRCMEEGDLEGFGIKDARHRQMILAAAQGQDVEPDHNGGGGGGDDDDQDDDYYDDEEEEEDDDGGRRRRAVSTLSDDLPVAKPHRPMIVLDDDFDDDIVILPNQKKFDFDDDDIVLPKKQIILEDSDDDLPIPPKPGAGGKAAVIGDDI